MHENREISSAPWSDDQGRSAKAKSRTADRHVLEKSDCAVVPVNQLNKGGQPSAEAGEGRAQTRENIVQSHMHPTQSGKCMSQGLDGVRKAARERKQGQRCGCEFPWACGPPMEMKAAFPRPIDSKWVKARLSRECKRVCANYRLAALPLGPVGKHAQGFRGTTLENRIVLELHDFVSDGSYRSEQ
jgi:hypothetical protein